MIYEGRIETNPEVMMGKPVIRGTRIPVYVILNLLGEGRNPDEIKKEYPDVSNEDILAVLKFAAHTVEFEDVEKALV